MNPRMAAALFLNTLLAFAIAVHYVIIPIQILGILKRIVLFIILLLLDPKMHMNESKGLTHYTVASIVILRNLKIPQISEMVLSNHNFQ